MNLLFYLFSSFALISALQVIFSRNPVHSVLYLILVFFNAAGLLVLLGLDFFAMIFLVVYVGAIAVLFLFVVMMLNIKLAEIDEKRSRYLPIGGLIGVFFLFEIFLIVDNDCIPRLPTTKQYTHIYNDWLHFFGPTSHNNTFFYTDWSSLLERYTNIESIGESMYTYYSYRFLMASLILLVAMIGAIVLTMHKGVHVKRQEVFEQNMREFAKTVRKIK